MPQLLAILLVLVAALMLLARLFLGASPGALAKAVKVIGVAVAMLLLFRVAGLLWIPGALVAAVVYAIARAARKAANWSPAGSGASTAADTSQVETRWLRMTLEHDSGRLDGEVLDGPFRGRRLSQLSRDEALRLYRDIAADPQSRQLMESWLDRAHSAWRDQPEPEPEAPPARGGRMSREEAYAVLGLEAGASADEVKAAHHRLMRACHPDHGGSDWLAARLNQAKDALLG
jgi:hypothetical protein